jgi:Uma2 family endonuclease
MDLATKHRATFQDVIDSPEHMVAEIIHGELRLSNQPVGPAFAVAAAILDELGPPLGRGRDGHGDWVILHEPELHLGDEIVVPDHAAWRRDQLPATPEGRFITVPPAWVCEVLSKATEKADRAEKMPIYAAHGVTYAWLAHPRWRTIEAFRIVDGKWLAVAVHSDADRARIEPFDAMELDLARLWVDAPLPARASEPPGTLRVEAH